MSFPRAELCARRASLDPVGNALAFGWVNTAPAVTAAPRTLNDARPNPEGWCRPIGSARHTSAGLIVRFPFERSFTP